MSAPRESAPAHILKVGRITVKQKNETEKKNPNSIRFLLGHIINAYFGGNITKASTGLKKFGGRYKDDRDDREPKTLNTKSISNILEDNDYIEYWQLEIFAQYIGIPTGGLLILSRMFAVARYNLDPEVASALAFGVSELATQLADVSWSELSIEEFQKLVRCFDRLREAENRSPTFF